jgi:hypothetical protein
MSLERRVCLFLWPGSRSAWPSSAMVAGSSPRTRRRRRRSRSPSSSLRRCSISAMRRRRSLSSFSTLAVLPGRAMEPLLPTRSRPPPVVKRTRFPAMSTVLAPTTAACGPIRSVKRWRRLTRLRDGPSRRARGRLLRSQRDANQYGLALRGVPLHAVRAQLGTSSQFARWFDS